MHKLTIDEGAAFDYLARDSNVPLEDVAARINELVTNPAAAGAGEDRPS